MKGLSKSKDDKVRHCELAKEVLDRVKFLYGGDRNVAQEEVKETCYSSNEPEHGEVVADHTLIDDEEVSEGRVFYSEHMLLLYNKCQEIDHSLSIYSCESLEDRETQESSSFNKDKPIIVAIEN